MARPKSLIPCETKKVSFHKDLCVRMELELYSEVEGRIPYGAMSELLNKLLREHYKQIDGNKPTAEDIELAHDILSGKL